MDEEQIKETWLENSYSSWHSLREVPVGPTKAEKFIDIVLLPEFPFSSEEEMKAQASQEETGYDFNEKKDQFRSNRAKFQFIIEEFDDTVPIRLFEVKQRLNTKSVGQVMVYDTNFPETYDAGPEIEIIERGIIFGEDDPTVRETAKSLNIPLHFVCPSCTWTGISSSMEEVGRSLLCPNCTEASENDIERLENLHIRFDGDYGINGKCMRFRAAALEYLGEDPAPVDPIGFMSGPTNQNLAVSIAIVRGEDYPEIRKYMQQTNNLEDMVAELETALAEIGFEDQEGNPSLQFNSSSIGPIIPWILAILTSFYNVDVENALENHGSAIDAVNKRDPDGYKYSWE